MTDEEMYNLLIQKSHNIKMHISADDIEQIAKRFLDAVTVRHGHWNIVQEEDENWNLLIYRKCSECGFIEIYEYCKHCPECGAKMDGDKDA